MNILSNNNAIKNEKDVSRSKDDDLGKIKRELEECRKKSEEYLNGWKRTQADFINYKKRHEESLDEWIIFCKTNLIAGLLPILDSFDTALKNAPKASDEKIQKWIDGVLKISEQLLKILKDAGLEETRSAGEKLNPQIHEAVDIVPSDKEEGTVIEELQKGYRLSGKVIRPAKVRVAKKKE